MKGDDIFVPIILAGGKGERFWPLSRKSHPKQFLRILPGGQSLIEATVSRVLSLSGWERTLVSTSAELVGLIREYLPELPRGNLIIEPEPRDTAPAVALAALRVSERFGSEAVMGIFPADHYVEDVEQFTATLRRAIALTAEEDVIATLGVIPKYPASAYGYIKRGEKVAGGVYRVEKFVEKPSVERARDYLATGDYYWNAGIFVGKARVFLEEFEKYAPHILATLRSGDLSGYGKLEKISIDYAIMEKTDRAVVIPADFGWDDLGDWTALERLWRGQSENVELARHIGIDTTGAIIYTTSQNDVIVTLGVKDVVIVRDGNVTLVVSKDRVQEIKQLLSEIRSREMTEIL